MAINNLLNILHENYNTYIEQKTAQKLSNNSINTYIRIIERFYDYIADELAENKFLSLKQINKHFLNSYFIKLQKDGLSSKTQQLHSLVLKNFLWHIADSDTKKYGYTKENIGKFKIKAEQKEKESFSQDDQKRIMNMINKLDAKDGFLPSRNSLLLKLLLFTGIRISELINIKWADIEDCQNHYEILIKGKGNKERKTYLSKDHAEINITSLREMANKGEYLISTSKGFQCDRKNLFSLVNGLLTKVGITKQGLHIFRHTLARNLVDQNYNLSVIKEVLGHSNITITAQFYAKADENVKRKALLTSSISGKVDFKTT
jgi:integrase/recombinase XerD